MTTVTVLGAAGYTGREVVRLLLAHAEFELTRVTSTTRAGIPLAEVHPELRARTDLVLEGFEAAVVAKSGAVVSCLPHHESAPVLAQVLNHNPRAKIVDLSADFRFNDVAVYRAAYGEHAAPELAAKAAYGLPELFRAKIRKTNLVGNPGCYPTGALIPLAPLAKAGLVGDAVIDSKSGLSGAGANPGPTTHFAKANESVAPYGLFTHRHTPEIQTHLDTYAGREVSLTFAPHLVPMDRGILSTVHVRLEKAVTREDLDALYTKAYGDEPFIRLLPASALPDTKYTTGTNFVDLGFALAPNGRRAVVVSALDNLVKGAAGQAVQNLNLLAGLPETLGLLDKRPLKVEALAR